MEKPFPLGEKLHNYFDNLSEKSLALVLAAHNKTGKKTPFAQAWYRFFLDVVLARPAIAFVDTEQRLTNLENIGLPESAIASLILIHIILDHSLPNLVIAAAYPIIDHLTQLPIAATGTLAYLAGRFTYGASTGLARETFHSVINPPTSS